MLAKRKFFQVGLILTAIFVIFFTYFFKSVDVKQNIEEKQEIVKEDFSEEEINKFENVEYQGVDNSGNRFVIGSEFAQFEQERPEIINMEVLKCTFYFKDNTFLTTIPIPKFFLLIIFTALTMLLLKLIRGILFPVNITSFTSNSALPKFPPGW